MLKKTIVNKMKEYSFSFEISNDSALHMIFILVNLLIDTSASKCLIVSTISFFSLLFTTEHCTK